MNILVVQKTPHGFLELRKSLKEGGNEIFGTCCPELKTHKRKEILTIMIERIDSLIMSAKIDQVLIDLFLTNEDEPEEQLISVEIINEICKKHKKLQISFMTDKVLTNNSFQNTGISINWNLLYRNNLVSIKN